MADVRYTGNAAAVAQVDTFTPANVEVGDIFTLTVTGLDGTSHAINFTATAATVANVTAGLTAAWNASTNVLCTPMTAADGTTEMTLTADTAGDAFSVASTAVNGGAADTQTLTRAATTANAGPKNWNDTGNWSGGAVPGGAANQDVFVEGATILYGLDQSGIANTLDSLNISESQIGSNPAEGYLATNLQIKATVINIGEHYGPSSAAQSAPINIDAGATASTITVWNSGSNGTMPAIRLKANQANTTITVLKGKVGIAYEDSETTTIGTLTVSYLTNVTTDADVYVGSGLTVTTIIKYGGDLILRSAATTITNTAGTFKTYGSGAITTIYVKGGTVELNSTGTITTLEVTKGDVDCTKSTAARTITTPKVDPGGSFKYDPSIVTLTNKIQPVITAGHVKYTAA